jgi:hypothetical protein
MHKFSQITTIRVEDKFSYEGKIFLSLDTDWAHDDVLADSIDLIEDAGVAATWYITHDTPLLKRLRDNPMFELGIHPNFNLLLQGREKGGLDAEEVIDRLLEIVPEAKSVRSHSLLQSERLMDMFAERGLKHVSNTYVPRSSEITIKPWFLWSGLVVVPHSFQDNVELRLGRKSIEYNNHGLRVLDFHPIHIFLNTESLDRYENTRHLHRQPSDLMKYRSADPEGVREIFKQILKTPA